MRRIVVVWDVMLAGDSTSLKNAEGMCHLHTQGLKVQVTTSMSSSGEGVVGMTHILPFCDNAGPQVTVLVNFLVTGIGLDHGLIPLVT